MKRTVTAITLILSVIILNSCTDGNRGGATTKNVRQPVDTIGFAQYPWQMDSLMQRMTRANAWQEEDGEPWKLAICPHDDYTYVGGLYPQLLQHVKAPNLILIGVAHKAASLGIEGSLVFDSFTHWRGPWSDVPVSSAREDLFSKLEGYAIISDTLQRVEHSVESMVPFLQYFNREVSIVSILVPAMSPERMEECGNALATAISEVAASRGWEWGTDYSIIVTTDAVHYGNEDWGGADRAYFGCDDAGNAKARDHEAEIIENCLAGEVGKPNFRLFSDYTLNKDNFREYKWTWCGRYSVPVALYTSYFLNNEQLLKGEEIGYSTSITSEHIPVDDLLMGRTAIATDCHWVGYAAVGYR